MQREREYVEDRIIPPSIIESTGEYVLPDYETDVRKILYTSSVPMGVELYFNNGRLEGVGEIKHVVVYTDNEDKISSSTFTTEYEISVKCDCKNYINHSECVRVVSSSVRLMGPRKMNVKTALELSLMLNEGRVITSCLECDPEEVETLEKTVSVKRTEILKTDKMDYEQTAATFEGAIEDEVKVLLVSADAGMPSISYEGSEIEIDGEYTVAALISVSDEIPVIYEVKIPYNRKITTDIPLNDKQMQTRDYIQKLEAKVEADENGASVRVYLTAFSRVFVPLVEQVSLVKDGFIRGYESVQSFEDMTYPLSVLSKPLDFDIESKAAFDSLDLGEVRNIVVVSATLRDSSVETKGNTAEVKGDVRFSGIACQVNEESNLEFVPFRFDACFAENVNNYSQNPEKLINDLHLCASSASALVEEDGIRFGAKVFGNLSSFARVSESVLSSIEPTEEYSFDEEGVITVYYPSSGETLFDIAKKFSRPVASIAEDNKLTVDVMNGDISDSCGKLLILNDN